MTVVQRIVQEPVQEGWWAGLERTRCKLERLWATAGYIVCCNMRVLPVVTQDASSDKRPSVSGPTLRKLALSAAVGVVLIFAAVIVLSLCNVTAFGCSTQQSALFSNPGNTDSRLHGLVHGNQWRASMQQHGHSEQAIPKTLYVSVKDKDKLGADTPSSVDKCKTLNPGYKIKIMGDTERMAVVEQHTPLLMPVYEKLKPTERNDFWSYLMLYLYGGWYIDHDVHCFKPFDDFKASFNNTARAIIGLEAVVPEANRNAIGFCCPVQYCHWVMGSVPGHTLFGHVVDLMLDVQAIAAADPESAAGKQIGNPIMTTGPGILTKAVEHFMALHDVYPIDIALEQPEMVHDLGVMPRSAVAVGGYGTPATTDNSLVFVKHMFAGTWKQQDGGSGSW